MTAPKRRKIRRDEIAARLRGRVPKVQAWPCDKYRHDIIGFAHEVLGVRWLSERQQQFLLAFQEGHYVSCRGGRKSGKTRAAAIAAWWYVCTFPEARVVLTAPVGDSVEKIIWRDIVLLYNQAPVALGGTMHMNPWTGWVDGPRAIFGRVAKDGGGVRGLSGANVAYIIDEASDVPDEIWETIDGNMAGGVDGEGRDSRALLISNPTRLQGFFYDSHYRDSRFTRVHMPAEPRDDVPGMATSAWIRGRAEAWGEETTQFLAHVLGNFPTEEAARCIQPAMLDAAVLRWDPSSARAGDLAIGVDPANSEKNDEAAFAVRRGDCIVELRTFRGQSADDLAGICRGLIEEHRVGDERVRIVLDAEGPVGAEATKSFRAMITELGSDRIQLVTLHWNDFRRKWPTLARSYLDLNGARWGALVASIRAGLALPGDQKLRDELLFATWVTHESGKRRVTDKDDFRDVLKRSPDRADAVINACWQWDPQAPREIAKSYSVPQSHAQPRQNQNGYDPYESAWR